MNGISWSAFLCLIYEFVYLDKSLEIVFKESCVKEIKDQSSNLSLKNRIKFKWLDEMCFRKLIFT